MKNNKNMNKNYTIILLFIFGFCQWTINAQNVGIGTVYPDNSALLDLSSNNSGLLVPRMTEADRNAIVSPATGLMVFQNNNIQDYYYFNGTVWVSMSSSSRSLFGNSGTNPTSNYIGTTDLNDFVVKTNSNEMFRISQNQNIGIGTVAPLGKLHLSSFLTSILISNDFEGNRILPLIVSGDQNWFTQTTEVATGAIASQSGAITSSQMSVMELTYNPTALATLSFNYATDSESCCDRLNFYIDGVLQADYGGATSWTLVSFSIVPGLHTFRWEYEKDGSVDVGRDAVFCR